MRKALCILTIALPTAVIAPASALPMAPIDIGADRGASAVVEVKGGHGHGHGHSHGWGRGHGHNAYGWSHGRKVGWRGHHCPPGHWKKGWC